MTSAKPFEKSETSPFILDNISTKKPVNPFNLKQFLLTATDGKRN